MTISLKIVPIRGIPLVEESDDLAMIILGLCSDAEQSFRDGDVLVVAQKIVSKSEGRLVQLADVKPSQAAVTLAAEVEKDPRLVELILQESTQVIRKAPGILIVRHRMGIISANAGIDQSNIDHGAGESALLLPVNPDRSALILRDALVKASGKDVGVIISDSMNRPWRLGSLGYAIGSAGVQVLDDRCGDVDLFGRQLQATMVSRADSIAASAVLVMGETNEGIPAAIVRGLPADNSVDTASDLIRPTERDLFL